MQFLENVNQVSGTQGRKGSGKLMVATVMSDLVQWGVMELRNELRYVLSFHNHDTFSYSIERGWEWCGHQHTIADVTYPRYTKDEVRMIMSEAIRVAEL